MQTTYAQKNETVQKASANTAESVVDSSSQSATLQRHASLANAAVQRAENPPRPNNTGLPDDLKNGVESLSGYSLDNVRVHYNSPKPATVQALAYTQGTDIHVAPGQEHALPHEAWHVTQQMAGRVSPTTNINGMPVNDNAALEHEADVMGEKAVTQRMGVANTSQNLSLERRCVNENTMPAQRKIVDFGSKNLDSNNDNKKKLSNKGRKKILEELENEWAEDNLYAKYRNVLKNNASDFFIKVNEELDKDENTLYVKTDGNGINLINPFTFLDKLATDYFLDPSKFKINSPKNKLNIEKVGDTVEYKPNSVENESKTSEGSTKKPAYVANVVAYYEEKGVKSIAEKYQNTLSEKDRLGIVVGLNCFSSILSENYWNCRNKIISATHEVTKPEIAYKVFGFLWDPDWCFQNKHVKSEDLRHLLYFAPNEKKIGFKEKEKINSTVIPYGVFRETVMCSPETQEMVGEKSKHYNPVYIHSLDGDSGSLNVPNDDDSDMSNGKSVLDKMDEHLKGKGEGDSYKNTEAKIVIGGYNFYGLDDRNILIEILKQEKEEDWFKVNDVTKKNIDEILNIFDLSEKKYYGKKIEQIRLNTQVGNRYDRLVRGAISEVYPRMLYPTEPNMLIKATDENDSIFDIPSLFKEKEGMKELIKQGSLKELIKQGSLWGMGASEGRVFKENLEKANGCYVGNGIGFVDWAEGASLSTDPRGFGRHLLVSGYEKYGQKDDWAPFWGEFNPDSVGESINIIKATIQQGQSYASAYRLMDMFMKTQKDVLQKPAIDEVQKSIKGCFDSVEFCINKFMSNAADDEKKRTLQAALNTLQAEVPNLQAEALKLQDELKTLGEASTLQAALNTLQAEAQKLQAEAPKLQAELKALGKAPTLQAEAPKLQAKVQKLQAELKALGKAQKLQAEAQKLQAEAPKLQAEVQKLQAELKALGKAPTLQAALNTLQAEVQKLQAALNTLQAEAPTLQAALNTLQAEAPTLQAALNTLQAEAPKLQAALNTLQAEAPKLQAELQEIKDKAIEIQKDAFKIQAKEIVERILNKLNDVAKGSNYVVRENPT